MAGDIGLDQEAAKTRPGDLGMSPNRVETLERPSYPSSSAMVSSTTRSPISRGAGASEEAGRGGCGFGRRGGGHPGLSRYGVLRWCEEWDAGFDRAGNYFAAGSTHSRSLLNILIF
jgi:hypothetical protein